MTPNWQVDWHDGLLLTAEHLSEQASLIAAPIINSVKLIQPYFWGISTLIFDEEKIDRDILSIQSVSGIFKNGQYFNFVAQTDSLLEINLRNIHSGSNVYLYYDINCLDHTAHKVQKRKCSLKLSTKINPDAIYLKIFEVGNSHFKPACLHSENLISLINPIIDITSQYTQLNYINAYLNTVDYNKCHPYQLYQSLLLVSLNLKHLNCNSSYNHDDIYSSITYLTGHLVNYIKTLYNYRCFIFTKTGHFWTLQKSIVKDAIKEIIMAIPKCDDKAHITESLIKISDKSNIESIVQFGTNGLSLIQIYTLPESIQMEAHYQYYHIDLMTPEFRSLPKDILLCVQILRQQQMDVPKCWIKC